MLTWSLADKILAFSNKEICLTWPVCVGWLVVDLSAVLDTHWCNELMNYYRNVSTILTRYF